MLASATVHSFSPPTPGMHPIASRMLDIILANAVDAQPSMEGDFAEFSKEDIARHFPTAKAQANRQVVRQLDDQRGFETHAQLIRRCSQSLLRTLPNEAELHLTLRREGLGNSEIAHLWPELIAVTADAFAAARAAHPAGV
ncbi:hypothetical protein [Devosia sp. Leaf420]|uniref:hypothetical protein n=1 Tax=Devosia sp. Leaf420 TaxID=1736374 RepID=UPI00078498AA|nr:hypothetical protein [Devosia sp. Leaf420]